MYSKNDYRYYLESRLSNSDDFLAHYGVKGMKWRKRKATKTLSDTSQFVSDLGTIGTIKGATLYDERVRKRAKDLKMYTVDSIAKESTRRTKLLNKKKPQIKAASRLLVAETANAAATGVHDALKVKRRKRRW